LAHFIFHFFFGNEKSLARQLSIAYRNTIQEGESSTLTETQYSKEEVKHLQKHNTARRKLNTYRNTIQLQSSIINCLQKHNTGMRKFNTYRNTIQQGGSSTLLPIKDPDNAESVRAILAVIFLLSIKAAQALMNNT
jgi:hypothetical protein